MSHSTPERRTLAAVRIPLVLATALGWVAAMSYGFSFWAPWNWALFSQLSCLAVGLAQVVTIVDLLSGARAARFARALRGGALVYATITMLVYATLLGADYSSWASAFEHLIVPVLAWLEWLLLPPVRRLSRWWPVAWALPTLAYLPLYIVRSREQKLYPFLNPQAHDFWWVVAALFVTLLGLGQVVLRAGNRAAGWAARRVGPELSEVSSDPPPGAKSPDVVPLDPLQRAQLARGDEDPDELDEACSPQAG